MKTRVARTTAGFRASALALVSEQAQARIAAEEAEAEEAEAEPRDGPPEPASDLPAPTVVEPKSPPVADDDTGDDPASQARIDREQREASLDAPRLASIAHETWIYEHPRRKSRRIGYLRAGAVVSRAEKPASFAGCKGGFYKIEPRGYVCLGKTASLDPFHPVVEATKTRARRDGLPYDYVMGRVPGPTFYTRLPSVREQSEAEPDLGYFKKRLKGIERDPDFVAMPEPGPVPASLLYGRGLPGLADDRPRGTELVVGRAKPRSGFALLSQFEHDGRRFGLTTDLVTIPLDRTRWVKPSAFHGATLSDELTLPMAFVMKKHATSFVRDEDGRMKPGDKLDFRASFGLTGKSERGYVETKDGTWLRSADLRVIESMSRPPTWAREGRRWIDVSILQQALVAYEGLKPVYVTLVSTGADGLQDPKKTHSTIQGVFLIHTKHVSITMDGDEVGDQFDLRDVPFVQYFTEGYALHAAYWHDDFGTPRSHGCVNLAPVDAAWVFNWTTPNVPEAWHGALALRGGTVVYTHP